MKNGLNNKKIKVEFYLLDCSNKNTSDEMLNVFEYDSILEMNEKIHLDCIKTIHNTNLNFNEDDNKHK